MTQITRLSSKCRDDDVTNRLVGRLDLEVSLRCFNCRLQPHSSQLLLLSIFDQLVSVSNLFVQITLELEKRFFLEEAGAIAQVQLLQLSLKL